VVKLENQQLQLTGAFVLLGCDAKRRSTAVTLFGFCPSLTFTIERQNKFSTLVLRSASVAGGDE
jgi:hypothetical protein